MKILVYGAGAVGGYLGAKLQLASHDVTLITRPDAAQAITQYDLAITEKGKTSKCKPTIATSVAQAFGSNANYDLIVLAMKSYDLLEALDPLVAFCPNPAAILTTQNGIDVEKICREIYPTQPIIAGSVTLPISRYTLYQLNVEKSGRGMGLAPTQPKQAVQPWVDLLQKAGITTKLVSSYRGLKWSKAYLNIVANASSAILNRSPAIVYKATPTFNMEMEMLKEATAVMKKLKIPLINLPGPAATNLEAAVRLVPAPILQLILRQMVGNGRGEKMPSFQMDLSQGKGKTEVMYHNGAIADAGEAAGLLMPVNRTLNTILTKLTREELNWRDFDGRPKRLLQEIQNYGKTTQLR